MTTATTNSISQKKMASQPTEQRSAALRYRADQLQEMKIDFVPNPEFDEQTSLVDELVDQALDAEHSCSDNIASLPPHLKRLCDSQLLNRAEETALFRQMNFLKFRADLLRRQLDHQQPRLSLVEEIEELLTKSRLIRDRILKANMRLVMSIAKRFVTSQKSYDDLLSEGTCTLMYAVEKFNYARGFRFSTYAYRSIVRTLYRAVAAAQREEARFTRDAEQWAFQVSGSSNKSRTSDQIWENLRELTTSMLEKLDRREQLIIRSRYALGAHRKVRTFQYLGDKLGISKERARQLEKRALAKLQDMAVQCRTDELLGAALA